MSFTDEDLKQLKEDIVPYFPHKLPALIARLEAAEAYIDAEQKWRWKWDQPDNMEFHNLRTMTFQDWLRAKGEKVAPK
jgi:hypothetical protein